MSKIRSSTNFSIFAFILKCICSCIVLCICAVLPIILIPILIYRWVLFKYAAHFHRDLAHPLRGHGAVFLSEEPHVDMHNNLLLVFKVSGALDFEKTKAIFMDRFITAKHNGKGGARRRGLKFPEIHQYICRWAGYFFWKWDPDFSVDNHMRLRHMAEGEDIAKIQVDFLKEPLPKNRSPWQFMAVQGNEPYHHILIKFHHSLGDGYTIRMLMLCADEPAVFIKAPEEPRVPLSTRLAQWVKFPFRAVAAVPRLAKINSPSLPWPAIPSEVASGRGTRNHHVSVGTGGTQTVKLDLVKNVAKQHGVTTTAVLYGAVTGGLRAFIVSKYGAASIPDFVTSPQHVPVPTRPDGLLNAMSMVTYNFPIGDPDATSRLHSMERCLNDRKKSMEPAITNFFFDLMYSWLPYTLRTDIKPQIPLQTSNVPGPLQKIRLGGQEVDGMRFLFAATPTSFYISILSYNGTVEWVCNGDSRVVSQEEVQRIGVLIANEFDSLAKLHPRAISLSVD